MALDIYVGPLVRYYRGDWETVAQRWSRESGVPLTVIRPEGEPEPPMPVPDVIEMITDWRDYLNRSLAPHITGNIEWTEDASGQYTTDRPGHEAYGALILWAAYADQPALKCPASMPADFTQDAAYLASNAEGFKSRFGQLLHEVEIWLPANFAFTFRAAHLGDGEVEMGSSFALLDQLHALNSATWNLSEADCRELRAAGPEKGGTLESAAKFGYAVMEPLALASTVGPWPMKLDY